MNVLRHLPLLWCLSLAASLGTAALLPACQPTASPTPLDFKTGDTLHVAADRTDLMVGSKILATLSRGKPVVVTEVRDGWIGVCVSTDGQHLHGWVQPPHFQTTSTAASSTGPQLACTASSSCVEVCDDSDPFLVGRYERHELDPNMHVWEPWRQ